MRLTVTLVRELELLLAMAERTDVPVLVLAARKFRVALHKGQDPQTLQQTRVGFGYQFALWEDDGSPWRGRLGPETPFRCEHFQCTIPIKTCIQRQDALWPGKRAAIHEFCASGDCRQGEMIRVRSAYCAGLDWASRSKAGKAAFQFFRADAGAQRAARRQYLQSMPERCLSDEDNETRPKPEDEDEDVKQLLRGGE